MGTSIFVNIPTTDLERAKAFYTALGCTINPNFTDDNAACVVWSDTIYFMVLTREFFATFTDKPIGDPNEAVQVSLSFTRDSREDVDAILALGLAAGATVTPSTVDSSSNGPSPPGPAPPSSLRRWCPPKIGRASCRERVSSPV